MFEDLDLRVRRKLRRVVWKQWKRPRMRAKEPAHRGVDCEIDRRATYNRYGTWCCIRPNAVNRAVRTSILRHLGIVSLLEQHRRFANTY